MGQHVIFGIRAHRAVVAVIYAYAFYFEKLSFKVFWELALIELLEHGNAVVGLTQLFVYGLPGHAEEGGALVVEVVAIGVVQPVRHGIDGYFALGGRQYLPVGHYLAPLCAYAGHADCIAPFHLGEYEIWRPLYEPPVAGLYGYHAMLAGYVAQKGRGICSGEVDYGEYLALVDLDIIVQYGGYLQRIEYVHVFGDKLIFAYEPF